MWKTVNIFTGGNNPLIDIIKLLHLKAPAATLTLLKLRPLSKHTSKIQTSKKSFLAV
jgi:hypothetical protein